MHLRRCPEARASPVSSNSGLYELACDRSILDCNLPEIEDPSDNEKVTGTRGTAYRCSNVSGSDKNRHTGSSLDNNLFTPIQ